MVCRRSSPLIRTTNSSVSLAGVRIFREIEYIKTRGIFPDESSSQPLKDMIVWRRQISAL